VKLKYLETWCEERIRRAAAYGALFDRSRAANSGAVRVPAKSADKSHVFNNYVIRAARRDELKQFLAEQGIQSEIYYPLPLHLQKCFAELGHREGDFPCAELAAREVLALPLYPELGAAQHEEIVGAIEAFYRRCLSFHRAGPCDKNQLSARRPAWPNQKLAIPPPARTATSRATKSGWKAKAFRS